MATKQIPQEWNRAVAVSILKKVDKTDLKNYRPTTLVSQICEVQYVYKY